MHRILILLMASTAPLLANPRLTARYAPDFNPKQALHDPAAWSKAKPVTLRGSNKIKTPPATMRILWNEKAAFFVFNGTDRKVVSPGKRDGLEQYQLGDTSEVFIGRRGQLGYLEAHATPTGKKTLYFYRDYLKATTPPKSADRVRVISTRTENGWRTIFTVPWEVLGGREAPDGWDVFFGRYDYDVAEKDPRLSSFPVIKEKPNFHRREKYGVLHFKQ